MRSFIFILNLCTCLCFTNNFVYSQNEGRQWIFGDHAGLDFNNPAGPVSFYSPLQGANVVSLYSNICDSNGQLLFYAFAWPNIGQGVQVFNRLNSTMINGDGIVGHSGNMQSILILPAPGSDSIYYMFTIGQANTASYQILYYHIIDVKAHSGIGRVLVKNQPLVHDTVWNRISAVRHGNGRDWWIMGQKLWSNDYYRILLTPAGLEPVLTQTIGRPANITPYACCSGLMKFSPSGSRLAVANLKANQIELFTFDRCTGLLAEYVNIADTVYSPDNSYYCLEFSPNENYLYATNRKATNHCTFQFDLLAPSIIATKTILNCYPDTGQTYALKYGPMLLGADGRIYINKGTLSLQPFNVYNQNMDVILDPDSPGLLANYSSNYFYLGGNTSYAGLPNMVNYELGPSNGSGCDSLMLDIQESPTEKNYLITLQNDNILKVSYNQNKVDRVILYDLQGRKAIDLEPENEEVGIQKLSGGIYFVVAQVGSIAIREKIFISSY